MKKLLANFKTLMSISQASISLVTDPIDSYLINEDTDPNASIQTKRFHLLMDYYESWYFTHFFLIKDFSYL